MLLSFLVIGGTKCGTTSLHGWLSRHPAVFMAPKETRCFTAEHNLSKGREWYEAQFAGAENAEAVGDSSNAYTRAPVYDGVSIRIAKLLPQAQLVYLVRDPMRRMESHYRHRLVMGTEWRAAREAIEGDPSYLAASLYGHQLKLYRAQFPPQQIMVVRSEAMFADPARWLPRIERFIGATRPAEHGFEAENVTAERRSVPAPLRRLVAVPALRPILPRVPRWLSSVGLSCLGQTADEPPFELDEPFRARLRERLAVDRDLLAALAGEAVADWPL